MATTIYTYLHNDDMNGSRIVSMDDCMCKLYNIKREDSNFFKEFESDLQKPALYILLNRSQSKAYIGETDDFLKRINNHIAKKSFWKEVMVFLGTNEDTLSKTEVQYLEYLALEKATKTKSFDLSENQQLGKIPNMSVMQRGKTAKFFDYVQFLSKFIGCDIFEERKNITRTYPVVKSNIAPAKVDLTADDLAGRIFLSLNGRGKYCKRKFVWHVVKEYLKAYPNTTISELKGVFKRDYLLSYSQYEFIQEDISSALKWKECGLTHCVYLVKKNEILQTGDGVKFAVCSEWSKSNILNVLGIVKTLGWSFEIVK